MTGHLGTIASSTLDDLADLRLKESEQTIPTLEQVLDILDGEVPLLVEIKSEPEQPGRLESLVGRQVGRFGGPVAVMSKNRDSVRQVRLEQPGIVSGWVIERAYFSQAERAPGSEDFWLKDGVDFLACDHRGLPHRWVDKARQEGLPVLAWTVKSAKSAARLQDHADNIIFENYLPRHDKISG